MTQAGTKSAEAKAGGQAELFAAGEPGKRDWEGLSGIYGKSVRTLKRYDQDGRAAGDLCPLEEPGEMPGWWQKHMKQQVPSWLLNAAKIAGTATTVDPAPATPVDVPALIPAEEEIDLEVLDEELGLEKTLDRLAKLEVRLSRKAHQPGQNKAWLDTISRMGTVAEKLRTEHERLRKLIPLTEAETMIHEFHAPIERETRQLARTMCAITGLPFTPHIQEAWNKECDRLFARFQQEVFH